MLRARWLLTLSTLVLLVRGLPAASPGVAVSPALTPEEQALKAAHLPTNGPALLEFFRQRMTVQAPAEQLDALVRQLRDPAPEVHQKAFAALVSLGTVAIPPLRRAANDVEDPEAAGRARQCLQLIEGPPPPGIPVAGNQVAAPAGGAAAMSLPAAAARLVALHRPEGAAEVLLGYLPFAPDDPAVREVEAALAAVGFRDHKPDPALLSALKDPVPLRRAVAATVLCRVGGAEQRPVVRPLLKDPKPTVRLSAAQGLANLHDADAVAVLIDLLTELPAGSRYQAQASLNGLAGEWSLGNVPTGDATGMRLRRDAWAAWWRSTDGPRLLEELRRRTLTEDDREKASALVRRLGADSFAERERASSELVALGGRAAPLLRQAAEEADPRVSPAAARCLQLLEPTAPGPLPAVVPRLVMLRRPEGATEALLGYVPFAESRSLAAQVREALGVVAVREGTPDPALLRALEDKAPSRRALAAEVLCEAGPAEHLPAVRRLLRDPAPEVRQRVALALVAARDREGVPVLISLLAELPPEHSGRIDEFLRRLAGDQAPAASPGNDEATRQRCRDAWAAWWKEHGPALDLAHMENPRWLFGHALIVQTSNPLGRVLELDRDGKVCWQVEGLLGPVDAHVVRGGRVLIAEQNGNRVTERDLKGHVLWQKAVVAPIACQRLPNGNTFIACRNQVVEVDRNGREVFTHSRPAPDLVMARKLTDGRTALFRQGFQWSELDAAGKEVKTTRITLQYWNGDVQLLADGRILVPQGYLGKVVEYDTDGRLVWEAAVPQPLSAARLANGNTLVVCQGAPVRLLEVDRTGKVVWECRENVGYSRVRR